MASVRNYREAYVSNFRRMTAEQRREEIAYLHGMNDALCSVERVTTPVATPASADAWDEGESEQEQKMRLIGV